MLVERHPKKSRNEYCYPEGDCIEMLPSGLLSTSMKNSLTRLTDERQLDAADTYLRVVAFPCTKVPVKRTS
jgi:hypothetical protein